jgi:hypothetical protein
MISLLLSPFWMLSVFTGFLNGLPVPGALQDQGVEGSVYRVRGNQMPSPDRKPTSPTGFKTYVYIFELTNMNQVTRQGQTAFYSSIKSKFIKKLETGPDGHFSVKLPTGRYSFFTKKNQLFYANGFDAENNIAPVTVQPGKFTRIEIRIDYDANY